MQQTKHQPQEYFFRTTKESNNHFDYIDALRGIAVLGVVMAHTVQLGTIHEPLNPSLGNIIHSGLYGVQLFYLLSAFTLFLSMKKRSSKEKNPIKNFAIRRFFRIAPMYYLAIVYYLWQDGFGERYWLGDATRISISHILSNVFFVHGFNPYWINSIVPGGWSIGVEMMFYAILPLLFLKIKRINQAFIFLITTLIIKFLLRILMKFVTIGPDYLWDAYSYFYLPSQLPVFVLGIIMYFIVVEKDNLYRISGKYILVLAICILVDLSMDQRVVLSMHILFGIGFLALAIAISTYKSKIFINPLTIYIGKISYSMYLVHFAVFYWLSRWGFVDYVTNDYLNYVIRFLIAVAITAVISTLTYHIMEIPFQKIGKNLITKSECSTKVTSQT